MQQKSLQTKKSVKNINVKKFVFPFNNGLAIIKDEKLCLSFIDGDGQKRIECKRLSFKKLWGIAFLRGLLYFFVGIVLYIKALLLEDEINIRAKEEQNIEYANAKKMDFISNYFLLIAFILIGFIYGFFVLGVLPSFLIQWANISKDFYLNRFLIALFRTAVIYLTFVILRFSPFMQGFLKFNSAGQRIINEAKPFNFLNFILNVCLFSTFMISLIAVNIFWVADFFINSLLFLFIISISFEIILMISKAKTNLFRDFAFILTWLVYLKPNTTHLEIANMIKIELENKSEEKYKESQIPLSSVFAEMQTKLETSERFEKSDIEWIVATVLGISRSEIKLRKFVSKEEAKKILSLCNRRAKGEPLSNIFGFVDFYGCHIEVNKKVLSPRFETEILVEECLKIINKEKIETVLDLCTGSGVIAIAIAKNSNAKVYASDVSKPALSIAELNAKNNHAKVEFIHSDLFSSIKKKFDLIVSNPPYIKSLDIEKLDVEVKDYDPKIALDGGNDGLDFYKEIISKAPSFLKNKGYLFFEVGKGQSKKVVNMMQKSNFVDINVVNDYNKIERIVYGRIDK